MLARTKTFFNILYPNQKNKSTINSIRGNKTRFKYRFTVAAQFNSDDLFFIIFAAYNTVKRSIHLTCLITENSTAIFRHNEDCGALC